MMMALNTFPTPAMGKQGVDRFLSRYPQLHSTVGRPIDAIRLKDVTKDALLKRFEGAQAREEDQEDQSYFSTILLHG